MRVSASPDHDPDDANLQTGSLVLGAGSALVTAGAAIMVNAAIPVRPICGARCTAGG
jgi:hypothetical protein